MSDKIKVAIKVRHLIDGEKSEGLVSQWEVIDPKTNNYEVFNTVAWTIIDSSLSGFNGTIFAYGQTSSEWYIPDDLFDTSDSPDDEHWVARNM